MLDAGSSGVSSAVTRESTTAKMGCTVPMAAEQSVPTARCGHSRRFSFSSRPKPTLTAFSSSVCRGGGTGLHGVGWFRGTRYRRYRGHGWPVSILTALPTPISAGFWGDKVRLEPQKKRAKMDTVEAQGP